MFSIAQKSKYLGIFWIFLFYDKMYVVCTPLNRLTEAILMSILKIPLVARTACDWN